MNRSLPSLNRRQFIINTSAVIGSTLAANPFSLYAAKPIAACGPASKYKPTVKAAFVRRKEEYGMRWPGAVYDGEAARQKFQTEFSQAAKDMGIQFDLRPVPIYSEAEADEWVDQAKAAKPDGLFVILLDRQQHSWPTAKMAMDTGIPTVIYSPIGTSFTTNTLPIADHSNMFISSTDDLRQPIYGLKMLQAGARLREMRYIVLKGKERFESRVDHFGTRLRYVPAQTFLDEYRKTSDSKEIDRIAEEYLSQASHIHGATKRDVQNGVKSFVAARNILEREEGDGITMDCLGALGNSEVSLPCISWSRMLDHAIPAACEADIGAALTHALVQYLYDRPGFQQDPVAETVKNCLIGAHCTCPTRLHGFDKPAEKFRVAHHHGNRDAVPIPHWTVGQRMTSADILLNKDKPQMIISSGTVVDNVSVPPAGGCVVSVMVEFDGVDDYLAYPGFHQIFFYGDYKQELRDYCQLFDIEPVVV